MTEILANPAALGLDAAMVAVVNEATNWLKEQIEEFGLSQKLSRLYPFLPFIAGIGLCWLFQPSWACIKTGMMYGLWANASWAAYRVTVKGK